MSTLRIDDRRVATGLFGALATVWLTIVALVAVFVLAQLASYPLTWHGLSHVLATLMPGDPALWIGFTA